MFQHQMFLTRSAMLRRGGRGGLSELKEEQATEKTNGMQTITSIYLFLQT
jgi:hypothetical protein